VRFSDTRIIVLSAITAFFLLTGCSPEVGSEKWCANMKSKPKGDWTMNEVSDYTKHCAFK
jgi:hypothetical protein